MSPTLDPPRTTTRSRQRADSKLVAVSHSMAIVPAGRVLQGTGLAVMPLAIGIARSLIPPERVPSSLGLLSALTGIGTGAGLLVSGLLVKAGVTAQGMFWISAAVTALGLVGTAVFIRLPERAKAFRVGVLGLLPLGGGLVCLVLGINREPSWGWGSGGVPGLFGGALVLLAAWVVVERRVRQPLVDIGMMRTPVVLGTNIAAFLTGTGMSGAFVLIIQFVQTPSRVGYSVNQTLRSIGGSIGTAVATAVLAANTVPGLPLPELDAFSTAFAVCGGIWVLAVIATAPIPYRHRTAA